jgi:hypothetical protein
MSVVKYFKNQAIYGMFDLTLIHVKYCYSIINDGLLTTLYDLQ